jgi:hypothetical protein
VWWGPLRDATTTITMPMTIQTTMNRSASTGATYISASYA